MVPPAAKVHIQTFQCRSASFTTVLEFVTFSVRPELEQAFECNVTQLDDKIRIEPTGDLGTIVTRRQVQ